MINRILTLALCAWASVGCAAQPAGHFTNTGYQNPTYSYSVGYLDGTLVLPQGWVLDNFYSAPEGLIPRVDTGYLTAVHLDRDGDRVPDAPLKLATYDLRFVHGAHPGVIWVRTFPYSYHLHEKPLDQLAREYVAYIAAVGTEAAIIDDRAPGPPQVGVNAVSQSAWWVAGHPATVLDVEETRMTGGSPRRARVVLLRPGFMYQHTNQRRETVLYPVLMVAGYSNSTEQFAAGEADFEALLGQISVQGVSGLTKPETAGGTDLEGAAANDPSGAVAPIEAEPGSAEEPGLAPSEASDGADAATGASD